MFQPKELTKTMIRKSFVNYFYRKGLSFADLSAIADRMRHSVNIAQQSYLKTNISFNESEYVESKELRAVPQPLQRKKKGA